MKKFLSIPAVYMSGPVLQPQIRDSHMSLTVPGIFLAKFNQLSSRPLGISLAH